MIVFLDLHLRMKKLQIMETMNICMLKIWGEKVHHVNMFLKNVKRQF